MSNLPFQDEKAYSRFQCFVCGTKFQEYEEYKDHIIESHDEGREWLRCPLERCGAPVRDMRVHFKSKHADIPLPKNCQLKAMVWKDVGKNGKMVTKKMKFAEGWLSSAKNGKEMHYRSGYERDIYGCLEQMQDVVKYDVEPFSVKYSYEGKAHDYHPDLSVVFMDGRVEIWEIKPEKQIHLPVNQAKWAACHAYCESRGWKFGVITEDDIAALKSKVENA